MIPRTFYKGDAVVWIDENVPEGATSVTTWLRSNVAGAGASASGVLTDLGWELTLSATATINLPAGDWGYQSKAVVDSEPRTYDAGRVEILESFAYAGAPGAIDLRSQSEKDLEEVEQAIRALTTGAQSYTIGTGSGGRTFTRPMLAQLVAWRDRLVQKVAQERQADGTGRKTRRILARID